MTWAKLDDGFWSHPKVIAAGNEAVGVYCRALAYCGAHLTEGHIPTEILKFITAGRMRPITRLVETRLVERVADGYVIPDYLEFNPSREEVEKRRGKDVRRSAFHRDRELVEAIRERDGDKCRYCARTVDWTDRRSPVGGTYDHVDPDGPNTVENVVVACRGCNGTKGRRTPEQAAMNLIPIRSRSDLDQNNGANPNLNTRPVPSRPVPNVPLEHSHEDDFTEWLGHYQATTGKTSVRGSKLARREFNARRKDFSLADLKQATVGVHSDDYLRERGFDMPETILRESKVERYIELGRKVAKVDSNASGLTLNDAITAKRERLAAQGAS